MEYFNNLYENKAIVINSLNVRGHYPINIYTIDLNKVVKRYIQHIKYKAALDACSSLKEKIWLADLHSDLITILNSAEKILGLEETRLT